MPIASETTRAYQGQFLCSIDGRGGEVLPSFDQLSDHYRERLSRQIR